MMKWTRRRAVIATVAALGTLGQAGGCNLSDQQWAGITQAVIQTGLLTLVTNLIDSLVSGTETI
ncbi:MAG: hypothetical protein ACKVS9_03380 [Phycisphaerae bacterium]